MTVQNCFSRLLVALFSIGLLSSCGGGGGSGQSSTSPTGGGGNNNPPPIVIEFNNGGTVFYVDDEDVTATIGDATAGGSSISATSLSITSSIDGEVASNLSLNSSTSFRLTDGVHLLTLEGDFGANGSASATFEVVVLPRRPEVPSDQKQAAGSEAKVPVVLVSFIPTTDGVNLDTSVADYSVRPWASSSVADIRDYIDTLFARKVFSLTEMSRFRGHSRSSDAYLGYEVVDHIVYYEAYPQVTYPRDSSKLIFDYASVMNRIGAKSLVEDQGVKEIWLSTYFAGDDVLLWESNMASPSSGDISNSDQRTDDLPVYSSTYVVYGMNYHRTQAEAVHNHGHQIERMLDFLDRRDNSRSDLFWGPYVGARNFPSSIMMELGLCGWTHSPPYTNDDYGYLSSGAVQSNCEDWNPDGSGVQKTISADYLTGLTYAWPRGAPNQITESNFYIWWGQNMPGMDNGIPYQGSTMRNWWELMNDWDATVTSGARLYQ